MRVLGLIPARGGSKGVPRKNLRLLGGEPLLAHTIEQAHEARRLDRVVLSTDDDEIAALGEVLGVEVPFRRPRALATDAAPMLGVLQHALAALDPRDEHYDAVCLLQPTSPLRPPGLIDRCIDTLVASGADVVMTVLPVPPEHNPHWVYERSGPSGALRLSTGEADPIPRRQDLPDAFHREGSVYVFRAAGIRQGLPYGTHVEGVELDPAQSVNIDEEADWARAEALLAAQP